MISSLFPITHAVHKHFIMAKQAGDSSIIGVVRDAVRIDLMHHGQGKNLWQTTRGIWWTLPLRSGLGRSVNELAGDLHSLWYVFNGAAKNTDANGPEQHCLVIQVIQT